MPTYMLEIGPQASLLEVDRRLRRHDCQLTHHYRNLSRLMGSSLVSVEGPEGHARDLLQDPAVLDGVPVQERPYVLPLGEEKQTRSATTPATPPIPYAVGARTNTMPQILRMTGGDVALSRSNGGKGTVIIVVDTGVDSSLVKNGFGGWSDYGSPWIDDTGHGTAQARTALAYAPEAFIMSIRPRPGLQGGIRESSLFAGLDAVVPIIEATYREWFFVLNNSWGEPTCDAPPRTCSSLHLRVLQRINAVGMALLAAGNSNLRCNGAPSIVDSAFPGAVVVAALDRYGREQPYSSRGPGQCSVLAPFIAAPTFGILPWGNGWKNFGDFGGGTSHATAQVSGAIAVLRGVYPKAGPLALQTAIAATARSAHTRYDNIDGFGMLRVPEALELMPQVGNHPLYPILAAAFQT